MVWPTTEVKLDIIDHKVNRVQSSMKENFIRLFVRKKLRGFRLYLYSNYIPVLSNEAKIKILQTTMENFK